MEQKHIIERMDDPKVAGGVILFGLLLGLGVQLGLWIADEITQARRIHARGSLD